MRLYQASGEALSLSLRLHLQAIKHDYFIKTGERLWPVVAEAGAQAVVIWHSLTMVIPQSITHCSPAGSNEREALGGELL